LVGIALFLVIPEIARRLGWAAASGLALAVCCVLIVLDKVLIRGSHSAREVIGPLLTATAVHSFLDGWSVRALSVQPFASVAVPLGLALHKVPEGLALGLITRRSMPSISKALVVSAGVEGLTLVGAIVEPGINESDATRFGAWWTAIVLAIVAGSFLFLGFHTFLENRKDSEAR
ncbi:MAG: ZIP family metal transporter, partial [Bryobacteraceae bacterium]